MMSLFQLPEPEVEINLHTFIREELSLALNKGVILKWSELQNLLPNNSDLIVAKEYYKMLVEDSSLVTALNHLEFTECYLHEPGRIRYQAFDGSKKEVHLRVDKESWQVWLEIIAIKHLQNWNCQNPFVSFRVELNGSPYRFSLLHYKATSSPFSKLIIRNLQTSSLPLNAFGETSLNLSELVSNKSNILICGATGSGKTSLLNSLLKATATEEHIVILEDTQELILPHKFCTRFLAQEHPSYNLEQFLTYSLRLSPDRIILGEMRSSEVVAYLLAMNTGHSGVMSTIHANSAVDGINRMAMMFNLYGKGLNNSEVMNMITRNLDYIIFLQNKKIKEIIKPLGSDQGQPFYETLFDAENFH